MKLLFSVFSPPTGTYGGIIRLKALARAAEDAGHEVLFCAAGPQVPPLAASNYRIHPTPASTILGLPAPISNRLSRMAQKRASVAMSGKQQFGDIWLVLAFTGYARVGFLKRSVENLLAAIDAFQPDALITDLDPAAFLAARISGLPIALPFQQIITSGEGSFGWRLMSRVAKRVLASYGIPPMTVSDLYNSPNVLKIVPSIPQLDGADPDRPDIRYVGHLLGSIQPPHPDDFQPEPGKRYVYVYVGTASLPMKTLQQVLPQVFPPEGDITCLVGSQLFDRMQIDGAVQYWPFLQADAILPQCDWTICHGGQNTIAQSLRYGVPLMIFSGGLFERHFNGERVAAAGAGINAAMSDFTPDTLRAMLARRDEFAANAATLGEQIEAGGGAEAALRHIEAMASH